MGEGIGFGCVSGLSLQSCCPIYKAVFDVQGGYTVVAKSEEILFCTFHALQDCLLCHDPLTVLNHTSIRMMAWWFGEVVASVVIFELNSMDFVQYTCIEECSKVRKTSRQLVRRKRFTPYQHVIKMHKGGTVAWPR